MPLTDEQKSILKHTNNQNTGAYCGRKDCPDMLGLVEKGLMLGPFKSSVIPPTEAYFYITREGRKEANHGVDSSATPGG